MHGITRNSEITQTIFASPAAVTLFGDALAPPKRVVETRIVVCCNKQLVGSVRLKGYVSFTSAGKANAVALSEDDIELARKSPFYLKSKFIWVLDLSYAYPEPYQAYPGGLGLWKVAKQYVPVVKELEAERERVLDAGLGPVVEEAFEGENMETEESLIPWKRKTFFPGDVCGARDCMKAADGYTMSIRKKKLWFGPICQECSVKYTTHKPVTLASLAQQRKGAADLATVLDCPVENVEGLLDEHGIDEHGRPTIRSRSEPAQLELSPEIVEPDDPSIERATAVVAVPRGDLEAIKAEFGPMKEKLAAFLIVDQAGMDLAANITKMVKARYEALEAMRKEAVKPLNDTKKSVQDAFKPVLGLLLDVEQTLKERMLEGQRRMDAAQDAALLHAQQAYQHGNMHQAALATQQAQASGIELSAGVSVRTTLDFEVLDIHAVPREFFVLDSAKVLHALRAGLEIPGIRRVLHESLAVRA